ncbi:MAG: winged helix-turn-helix domain-containing protein [Planctomycetes bacterium]|nr:winged helix-turn-helix domain-containing protein [Planctomycetota bacterium]
MATKKTTTKKTTAKKAAAPKATRSAKSTKAAPAKKAQPAKPAAKKTKPAAPKGEAKAKKLSAIDAAAKVLATAKEPMNCKELIEAMATKKLWTSPGGKTPNATLYSAILREIKAKGKDARFKKTERGQFAANG